MLYVTRKSDPRCSRVHEINRKKGLSRGCRWFVCVYRTWRRRPRGVILSRARGFLANRRDFRRSLCSSRFIRFPSARETRNAAAIASSLCTRLHPSVTRLRILFSEFDPPNAALGPPRSGSNGNANSFEPLQNFNAFEILKNRKFYNPFVLQQAKKKKKKKNVRTAACCTRFEPKNGFCSRIKNES